MRVSDWLWAVALYALWEGGGWWLLTRSCYEHVQEVIRADAHLGQRAVRAKERVAALGRRPWDHALRNLYPPTSVTPHPSLMKYVRLRPTLAFFAFMPFRRSLHGVTIHWTPLVRYPTGEWLDELTDAVAHFLGVGRSEVERVETSVMRKSATIVRTSG
jgi:hypothetical protein